MKLCKECKFYDSNACHLTLRPNWPVRVRPDGEACSAFIEKKKIKKGRK